MAIGDFTNQNIQDTYKRVVQTDGTNLADGSGSLLPISFEGNNVIIPGAVRANSYIVSESITVVTSGSTVFGNSSEDTHTFIGSITGSDRILISGSANGNAKLFLDDPGGDPSVNFRLNGTQKAVIGHDQSTTYNKFVAGTSLSNTTGIIMANTGRIGIGMIPSTVYTLRVANGIEISDSSATTPLLISALVPVGQDRYGTITLPSNGNRQQPHFRVFGDSGVCPGIYLGDAGDDVIYGVDQNNNDVWSISQTGLFSGTCNLASNLTASGDISASGLITGKINTTDSNTNAAHYFVLQTAVDTLPLISNGMNLNPSTDVLTVGGGIYTPSNITASIISASNKLIAGEVHFDSTSGTKFNYQGGDEIGTNGSLKINNSLNVVNNITSSANISASGNIAGDGLLLPYTNGIFFGGVGVITKGGANESLTFASDTELQGKTTITGNVTASKNISSSATVQALNVKAATSLQVNGKRIDYDDTNLRVRDTGLDVDGHITASGNISASGDMIAANMTADTYRTENRNLAGLASTNKLRLVYDSAIDFIEYGKDSNTSHFFYGSAITASGDISASGNLDLTGNANIDGTITIANNTKIQGENSSGFVRDIAYVGSGNRLFLGGTSQGTTVQANAANLILDSGGDITIDADSGNVYFKDNAQTSVTVNTTTGHITSSGNISSSGKITATSFDARTTSEGFLLQGAKVLYTDGDGHHHVGNHSVPLALTGSSIEIGHAGDTGLHVTASGNISASGTVEASSYTGVPVVLANNSEYLSSATSGDRWYYGNNTQGWYHTMTNHITVAPETGVDTNINQGGQHNSFIVPFDVKDIEFRSSVRMNKNNSRGAFWISRKPRQDGGSSYDDNFLFMASGSTIDTATLGASKFYNCDITGSHPFVTNMTASAGEEIYIFWNPYKINNDESGAESTAQKWTWTLSAKTV